MLAWLFILPENCFSEEKILEIVAVNSDKDETAKEFIKIKNISGLDIMLKTNLHLNLHIIDPSISDADKDKYKILNFSPSEVLKPSFYAIITPNTSNCVNPEDLCITYSTSGNTLKDGCTIYISKSQTDNKDVLDLYEIRDIPEPLKNYSSALRLNEVLPNPNGKDTEENAEWIELYNSTTKAIDLSKCKINKDILSGEIGALSFKIIYPSFTLTNTKFTLELLCEDLDIKDSVSYSDAKSGLYYSFDETDWHWNNKLTFEKENKFNSPPTGKSQKDKTIYVGVWADFEAKGSDKDKDKLKYTWDFGDGHKSYLAKTRHKFEKAGKYKVILKISDGTEDKITEDEIEVKNYPSKDIDIIEISPNPEGKDTENEYIILENKEKKELNLKDWSIATGAKKLYNHPIVEDLIIPKKGILKITREFSKFSLNNKKGKVELRYPNGKVASKIKYDKGEEGVAENEIYTKINKNWIWKNTAGLKTNAKLQNELKSSNKNADENIPKENSEEDGIVLSAETKRIFDNKFINYASKINPPEKFIAFENYPLLELENKYFFNPYFPVKKHYLLSLWEKTGEIIGIILSSQE